MAAVCRGMCHEPGKITDYSKLRPPTDVMAITSLPKPIKPTPTPIPGPTPVELRQASPALTPLQLTAQDVEMGERFRAKKGELDLGGADAEGESALGLEGLAAVDREAEQGAVFATDF